MPDKKAAKAVFANPLCFALSHSAYYSVRSEFPNGNRDLINISDIIDEARQSQIAWPFTAQYCSPLRCRWWRVFDDLNRLYYAVD